ncbi:MAG: alanyl-tRNA editing protein [Anaerolineae bacterium]
MTQLLYQSDSYLRAFEATVESVDAETAAVSLDRTAFYAGGGGQPCDLGVLHAGGRALRVTGAKRQGETVWHTLEEPAFVPGDVVQGTLDWQRRFSLMRTHTALHILCGVVFRDYGALVTGGNMEPLQGRMDFEFESLHQELVHEIEERINAEVAAARDVRVRILPRQEAFEIPDLIRTKVNLLPEGIAEVRTVEIVGLDLQADGGTHVANTRDVGRIHLVDYKSKGRINKRLHIALDELPAETP